MQSKKCENCGSEISCGAEEDKACWCARYDVQEENLKNIRAAYNDCLCEACLIKIGAATLKG